MNAIRVLAMLGLAALLAGGLSACRSSKEKTYDFDPLAHQRAVALKADAMGLVAVSGEPFGRHRESVEATNAKLEEAFSLSAAAPGNELVTAEWAAMKNPEGDLYRGFVRRWQARGTIDQATREAAVSRITARFDYILCLEVAKRTKAGRCTPPGAAESAVADAPAG